uniref:Uncharacterized protein n=1 Tax=Pan paniscus TaxID=9597 RepID=A0A2R8ZGH2_PANPA
MSDLFVFSSKLEGTPNLFVSRGPDGVVLGVEEPEGKAQGRVRGELCPGALARIHMGHSCTRLSAEGIAMLLGTAGPSRLPAAPDAYQAPLRSPWALSVAAALCSPVSCHPCGRHVVTFGHCPAQGPWGLGTFGHSFFGCLCK